MFAKNITTRENVLILGLGGMGFYLAKRLLHEGYSVTAIESDLAFIQYADCNIDARLIAGDAMSIHCWQEADAENMDILIAVTDNDAVNMMAASIGHQFGIKKKIARVRSLDYGDPDSILTAEQLKLDLLIHPEELISQEIVMLIQQTAGNEIVDIAQGQIQVMATRIDETSPLANRDLRTLSQTYNNYSFRVVAIARGITTILPGGSHTIQPQDLVLIMADANDFPPLMELTGMKQQQRYSVMILGGGLVGSRVAQLLGKSVRVKLIEKDKDRAADLASMLPYTEVLNGDGSDKEVLEVAGLREMDTFISATGENETNIMSCLLAKHIMSRKDDSLVDSQCKTIALVNKEEYLVLASTSGSDIALDKKILAGHEIISFIRQDEFLSVSHMHGFDIEVVELEAIEDAKITRKKLASLATSIAGKIIIGSVYRDGNWQTAMGDTHIQPGEKVIAICSSDDLKYLRELFLV